MCLPSSVLALCLLRRRRIIACRGVYGYHISFTNEGMDTGGWELIVPSLSGVGMVCIWLCELHCLGDDVGDDEASIIINIPQSRSCIGDGYAAGSPTTYPLANAPVICILVRWRDGSECTDGLTD